MTSQSPNGKSAPQPAKEPKFCAPWRRPIFHRWTGGGPWIERDPATGVPILRMPLPPPETAIQNANLLSALADSLRARRNFPTRPRPRGAS
jgi:hypothetical protein